MIILFSMSSCRFIFHCLVLVLFLTVFVWCVFSGCVHVYFLSVFVVGVCGLPCVVVMLNWQDILVSLSCFYLQDV